MIAATLLTAAPKWRRLSADERRTFIAALVLVPAMHVVVRVIGFNRLQLRVANTAARATRADVPTAQAVRACVISINRVKRFSILRGNCLSQSFALICLLRRRGIEPTLRLGARLTESKFDAHAWVEYDGRVLNDSQDVHTRFTPLVRKPDAR